MDDRLYKIGAQGELLSTETTKVVFDNGVNTRVAKTPEELQGWKPLTRVNQPQFSVYESILLSYTDTGDTIEEVYTVSKLPLEEIVAYNVQWWADNYVLVPVSADKIYYAASVSYDDGGNAFKLFQDTVPQILSGATLGMVTYLELYTQPDMTQEFTSEYIDSLKVVVSDEAELTAAIGYLAQQSFNQRTIPSVL